MDAARCHEILDKIYAGSYKGFDYAEDFADYEKMIVDAMAKDGGKPTLNLAGSANDYPPGIMVPVGSWNL